ncbi:MAG: hypothetical protein ABIN01_15195 [Ferruginibacter sp.]
MKKWLNNNKLYLTGALMGAIAGYLYWQQVGCASGTFMITSKPLNSTVYGGLLGVLLLGLFKKDDKQRLKNEKSQE